jgi:Ni/Fe-hydrogenase subunit HybB-like protein
MMLLPGSKLHPLWFTPWLPFLFLVNCIVMGYAIVAIEATFSSRAFRLPSETALIGSLGVVAAWLSLFWVAFRIAEVAWSGDLAWVATGLGAAFLAEVLLHVAGAAILLAPMLRARATWQVRAAILLVLAGTVFRINTYLVGFQPGAQFTYFPAVPELLITFGIIALEVAIYIAVVKRFPILSGAPAAAPARS